MRKREEMEEFQVIIGNSNYEFGKKICSLLNVTPVNTTIKMFANREICVKIHDNIRGKNIVIIQTGSSCYTDSNNRDINVMNEYYTVNDILVETQVIVDACNRSSAKSICVVFANFPYARQDKKCRARAPIGSAMVCRTMEVLGATRLVTMDLHSEQIQGMFNGAFDNLYASSTIVKYIKERKFIKEEDRSNWLVVAPDAGAVTRASDLASKLKLEMAIMSKRRNYKSVNVVESVELIGSDIKGKTVIIIDDMADTCGTVVKAVEELKKRGANQIYVIVTHGILSNPAIDRINKCDAITKFIVSDTIDQGYNKTYVNKDKFEVYSVTETFAKAIRAIHTDGGSVSALFD